MIGTTTDNASNIEKCFREFGIEAAVTETTTLTTHLTDEEVEEVENEAAVVREIVFPSSWLSEIENEVWSLPPHFHCPAHKLSLISSTDFMKVINQHELLKVNYIYEYVLVPTCIPKIHP